MSRVPLTLQLGNTIVSSRFCKFKHDGEVKFGLIDGLEMDSALVRCQLLCTMDQYSKIFPNTRIPNMCAM